MRRHTVYNQSPMSEDIKLEDIKPEDTKASNSLLQAVKVLVGMLLLALVLYLAKVDPRKLLEADKYYVSIALLYVLLSYVFGIKRWQILSQMLGINARLSRFTNLHFLGLFYNNLLPSGMAGDLVKAHYLTDRQHVHKSLLSVVLDRYVGLLVMLIVASVVALFQPHDSTHLKLSYAIWGILTAFIVGGGMALLFTDILANFLVKYHKPSLAEKLREMSELMWGFLKNYPVVGITFVLSVVSQAFGILAAYELSLSVGAIANPAAMFIVVPLVLLISALPISVGGLGTREAAFIQLLTPIYIANGMEADAAKHAAALVAILWLAISLVSSLPGLISYITTSKSK